MCSFLARGMVLLAFTVYQAESRATVAQANGTIVPDESSTPFLPSLDMAKSCPHLRIAVINGVSFHFEVLAGILHVLRPYESSTDVYMSPWIRNENYDGAWDLVKWSKATFRSVNANLKSLKLNYGLAILVSPDYELTANKKLLDQMNPRITVAVVHNSDFADMESLLKLSSNMELLTLSPHVSDSLSKATGRPASWMLPVLPVKPNPDCTSTFSRGDVVEAKDAPCLRGFAMQGKFSNLRRNYTAMWDQMAGSIDVLNNDPVLKKVFHMNVLGKGPDRLKLPPELLSHVSVHRRLPFQAFYWVISHTLALVPSLASPKYFTSKFSSTIITSLSTGTPIIASQELLKSYSFLSEASVFLQESTELEMDVMLKVSKLPLPRLMAVRKSLKDLRDSLNERSFELLEAFLSRACRYDQ